MSDRKREEALDFVVPKRERTEAMAVSDEITYYRLKSPKGQRPEHLPN
jgi:hypothetical protein